VDRHETCDQDIHVKKTSRTRKAPAASFPAEKQWEQVYQLWDELSQFPPSKTDEALTHLAQGLAKFLRADNVRWLGAVRVHRGAAARADGLLGWRLRASYNLVPDPAAYQKLIAWWFQRSNKIDPDFQIGLATHAIVAGAGKFRVHRMRDGWIPFAKFSRSEHYKLHYTELGITDRMWVSVPLNADAESIILLDRTRTPHFSKSDVALATTLLRGIRGLHRQLFLNAGLLIADAPLSPTARRILHKLLTGLSEKEIATAVGQPATTTHKYITTIYERFGVKSRAALMALWLGQG
jgi:DNA-binding CsgD family transcriptional regulator